MTETPQRRAVLDQLERLLAGHAGPGDAPMRYPTAISQTLGFDLVAVGPATATVRVAVTVARHANQQGTIHGGFLTELADAAIGTAHSTLMQPGESFTSVDLRATFLRPVWDDVLVATARATHSGRTISHYGCEVVRADGKVAATVSSTVLTLRGADARGR